MGAQKKAAAPVVARDVERDIGTAKVLKAHLVELLGEENADAETLRDAMEGETDLFETIDAVIGQIGLDEAAVGGIEKFASTLAARKARLNKRTELLRAALLNALDTIGDPAHKAQFTSIVETITRRATAALTGGKMDATVATITMKTTAPKLMIVSEPEIPSQFWKSPDPELSKSDLTTALKDRETTLSAKLAEINAAIEAGVIDADQAEEQRKRIHAAFPPIPGAELSNGGATVQIRYS